jgi:hypothetical protein
VTPSPTNWAATTYNLAIMYWNLADATPSAFSACAALPILRTDYPTYVPAAERLGNQINEKLTTQGVDDK